MLHARLQVVRHGGRRNPVKILVPPHVGANPLRELLALTGLRVREVGGTEHAEEDLRSAHLSGLSEDDRHRLAGVLDEDLLAGPELLPQDHIDAAAPLAVTLAEAAVLQPVLPLLVLEPEELERDPLPLQLHVDRRPVRNRGVGEKWQRLGKELRFERAVGEFGGERPGEAGGLHALSVRRGELCEMPRLWAMERFEWAAARSRRDSLILLMDNLSAVILPSLYESKEKRWRRRRVIQRRFSSADGRHVRGGRHLPEWSHAMPGIGGRHAPGRVDDSRRNQWTTWTRISGRNPPEYAPGPPSLASRTTIAEIINRCIAEGQLDRNAETSELLQPVSRNRLPKLEPRDRSDERATRKQHS